MDSVFAVSVLSLAFALTLNAKPMKPAKTVKSAYNEIKRDTKTELLTELIFQPGSSDLTEDARNQLRDLVDDAKTKGKIEDVVVIAWADKEYPPREVAKLNRDDRKISDDRLLEIKNFFTDNTSPKKIQTFNMAERPEALEKALQTSPNVKLKKSLEDAGVSLPYRTGMPTKASHAMVLISYE